MSELECTCGHEFSETGMFHLGDCPRKALPIVRRENRAKWWCRRCGAAFAGPKDQHEHVPFKDRAATNVDRKSLIPGDPYPKY